MSSDASIYSLANQPSAPLDPLGIQAKRIQIRNALAAGALQDQQIQSGALSLQQQQQAMTDQNSLRSAMRSMYAPAASGAPAPTAPAPPGATPAMAPAAGLPLNADGSALPTAPALPGQPAPAPPPAQVQRPPVPTIADLIQRGVSPADATGMISQFQKIDETSSTIDKNRADASKALQENTDLIRQQSSDMANMLVKNTPAGQPVNPDLLNWHLQHYASLGPQQAQQAQQIGQQLARLQPGDQLALLKSIAGTPKTIEANAASDTAGAKVLDANTAAARLDAERPKMDADALLAQLTAQGKAPIQPVDLARLQMDQQRVNAQLSGQAEARRHDLVDERSAALNREAVSLTPQALDQMATYFATTGQLPSLGMGAAVAKTRSDIINRAAQLYPNVTFASNAANFQANKASLKNVQGTLDTLSGFENAGLKNLKMFTDAAAKIPDTGVPWLNTPVRMLDEKLVGSTNMSVVNTARDVALREIARVTSDPKLSGALTDSARAEVQGLSPTNATLPQIIKVANTLQQDMANVHASLASQRDAINSRINVNPNAPAAPAAAAPAPAQKGDTVIYNGQPHKVLEVKPNGKYVLDGN